MSEQRFSIDEEKAGQRLDRVLALHLPGIGRKGARRLFEQGRVLVNGRTASKGDVGHAGDEITVAIAEITGPGALPEADAPLVVRYETELVAVVDKPAGQPTAPLRPGEQGTLANALVGRFPEMAGIGHIAREPGLVHRLDTNTSGLVVAARTAAAFEALSKGLKAGAFDKSYWLVCEAKDLAETGTIAIPLAHHPKDKRRMYPCVHPRDVERYSPRSATTTYKVIKVRGRFALVEAQAKTALRHQLRVHFAAIDHPLANDALYGGAKVPDLPGHALHACRIRWPGDAVVPAFDVTSPLPEPWTVLLGV
jgi:23S rRNA pseudouridine1911/1915/1917 synthase